MGRLLATALMLWAIVYPRQFIKVTEFWRLTNKEDNLNTLKVTRLMSLVVLMILWIPYLMSLFS